MDTMYAVKFLQLLRNTFDFAKMGLFISNNLVIIALLEAIILL